MSVIRDFRPLEPANFNESALADLPDAASLASKPLVVNPLDPEFAAPALTNQWSGLVAGRDPLSYLGLSSPELFHEGAQAELFIGIDGAPLVPASTQFEELMYQWHPSHIHRAAEAEGVAINVNTALSVTDQSVLSALALENTGDRAKRIDLYIRMHADLRTEWDMSWPPPEFAQARINRDGSRVLLTAPDGQATAVLGSLTEPVAVASLNRDDPAWDQALVRGSLPDALDAERHHVVLHYRFELEPGAETKLDFVHTMAKTRKEAESAWDSHSGDLNKGFREAVDAWEAEWRAAFTEGGEAFSGYAPVVSSDNPKLDRLYYMGIMTLLQVKRTPRFGSPASTYLTGFPSSQFTFHNNWVFPWDAKMVSGILSMLDPVRMKEMLVSWLEADMHQGCAIDFTTGEPVGFWYAVNDYALIHMVWQYVRYTGDTDFLERKVRDRTVLAHLKDAALYYQHIAGEDGLADYGGANNLLECVSTYTHKVASFNAANVWNQRIVADMFERAGDPATATDLRERASRLVDEVQKLYIWGDGVWSCLQPDGSRNVVRHCLDFHTVPQCMGEDLSKRQWDEMIAFFLRELKTETWMHALSPLDPDTSFSSRTDHQDEGAYTTWPAYAFEVLIQGGHGEEAMRWLGSPSQPGFADVTNQGPFGQAYNHGDDDSPRLAGAGAKAPMEQPHIEKPTLIAGGKYAQIVIQSVAGLEPELFGGVAINDPGLAPGLRLANLHIRGRNHQVSEA